MALGAHVVSCAAGVEVIRGRMFTHQLALTGKSKALLHHFVGFSRHMTQTDAEMHAHRLTRKLPSAMVRVVCRPQ